MKCPRFRCMYVSLFIAVLMIISAIVAAVFVQPSIKGCVASSTKLCAEIAGQIIEKGGTVADAAIAGLLCEGVSLPGSCGLGGGFVLILYSKEGEYILNAMPITSKDISATMFDSEGVPLEGPQSILIPGELFGYMELYKRFGKLRWEELFQPSIDLCNNGIEVNDYLEMLLRKKKDVIFKNPELRKIFYDETSETTLVSGQIFKMPVLAETLSIISREGAMALYDGSLTNKFIDDIPNRMIQRSDMRNYRPKWQTPVTTYVGDNTLLTAPIPAVGHMLTFFFNVLNGTITRDGYAESNWHIIVETFKFMFGKGTKLDDTKLGQKSAEKLIGQDEAVTTAHKIIQEFTHQVPEFYMTEYRSFQGMRDNLHTSHLCILTPNGDAISVTNSLNAVFGAGIMSPKTGIILNNDMSNFSNGSFPNEYGYYLRKKNRVGPSKQPMNPLCPAVLVNKDGSVKLVIGGTGGAHIITGVGLTIVKHIFFNVDIQTALTEYRLHHQLIPMNLVLEKLFVNDIRMVKYFKRVGHNISYHTPEGLQTVTAIANNSYSGITGVSDLRRGPDRVYYIY